MWEFLGYFLVTESFCIFPFAISVSYILDEGKIVVSRQT